MASSRNDSSSGKRLLSESAQHRSDRPDNASADLAPADMEKRPAPATPPRTSRLLGDESNGYEHHLGRAVKRHASWGQRSQKAESYERRIKRHWYPPLLLAIALNMFLLISVFYIIYQADYYSESRSGYLFRACLIIFVPLVPTAILLFWPWAGAWKDQRDAFSERTSSPRWVYVVNILSALASFFFVLCYLVFSAIPRYNTPIWETVIEYPRNVVTPTLALITTNNLTPATVSVRADEYGGSLFTAGMVTSEESRQFNGSETYSVEYFEPRGAFEAMTANIANISREQPRFDSPLQKILQVGARLQYNATSDDSSPLGDMPPLTIIAAYDSRLTIEEVVLCNLVQVQTPLAFASNMYLLSMSQISDPQRKMAPPEDYDPACERVYNDLLPHADPPLTIFDLSLMSSVPTSSNITEDCNIGIDPSASCLTLAAVTYGTQFVTTQRSVPGKSKQDIWIDCGAIVGAVQFFVWFAVVFFQP